MLPIKPNDSDARKYTSSSRIGHREVEIQVRLSERALELLALPEDDVPGFLLDIETISENWHQWIGFDISASMLTTFIDIANVVVEREVEGDLLLGDMGQWLCNADKSSHEPRWRLKAADFVFHPGFVGLRPAFWLLGQATTQEQRNPHRRFRGPTNTQVERNPNSVV
ncbi:hypothetical protein N665_0013s0021 [Sinapis alba]|nr:hypothetical protein N665_0013s0021 [Sinapis alba]